MKALDRKLLRDLANMKGQAFTIALVVSAGIGAFISQITTYDSLNWSRQSYYETTHFAHVFAYASRGGVLPDDHGFGVFWINRQRLASAFDMDGAFNHVVLSRQIATQRGEIAALKTMAIPTPRSPRTTSNWCC